MRGQFIANRAKCIQNKQNGIYSFPGVVIRARQEQDTDFCCCCIAHKFCMTD